MNTHSHKLAVLALLFSIALAGCALTDAHVNPGFTPESGKRSPLSTISSLAISIQVEDQRNPGEQDRVGDKKNNFGSVTAKVLSDKVPTTILYDALKAEFENNAHKIVLAEDRKADALIKIGLKRYWSDFAVHFFDIEMKGTLDADIAILNGIDQNQLASKPLNGTFRESRQIALEGAFEGALNGALFEFIRTFSRDPDVLDALRTVALQKGK
jgi:uncharacterized lipoprotein YehR (DUF1307 family)